MLGFDLTDIVSFIIGRQTANGVDAKIMDFFKDASEWPVVGGLFKGIVDMIEKHGGTNSSSTDNENETGGEIDAAKDPEKYLDQAVRAGLAPKMRDDYDAARADTSSPLNQVFAASVQDIRADLADDNKIEDATLAEELEEVSEAAYIAMAGPPQEFMEANNTVKYSATVNLNDNHWHALAGRFETKHRLETGEYSEDVKGVSGADELKSVLGDSIEVRRVYLNGEENGYFFSSADADGKQQGFFVREGALNLEDLPENIQEKLSEIEGQQLSAAPSAAPLVAPVV